MSVGARGRVTLRPPATPAPARGGAQPRRRTRALVQVTTQGGPFAGVGAPTLRRRAEKMIAHLGLRDVELSVALVDDATIHALNRRYRRKDKPTDVLAFPLEEPPRAQAPGRGRRLEPAAGSLLGDVILSMDTARRQARRHRRTLLGELTMLLAHGLLHLLGHDHQTDAEEREMTALTRELEAAAAARRPTRPGVSP
jgi:probable rRNA maturation factor